MMAAFSTDQASHEHSLRTLNALFEYDDFMMSIDSVVDMGCGGGLDLEWWATRCTRDEPPKPLNIRCQGIDLRPNLSLTTRYRNLQFQPHNFEDAFVKLKQREFDVIWCHDSFQYCLQPLQTLAMWWHLLTPGGMLVLILPQTTNIMHNQQQFYQTSGCYFHYTMPSLIHMLAVSGFDCLGGFFLKEAQDPWLHAIVYKSDQEPKDPRGTSWYDLLETGLLPESVQDSVMRRGFLHQQDLILPWVDKGIRSMRDH